MRNLKIAAKVLVLIIVAALIPIAVLCALSILESRNIINQMAREALEATTLSKADAVNTFFETYKEVTEYLAAEVAISEYYKNPSLQTEKTLVEFLVHLKEDFKQIDFVQVGFEDGKFFRNVAMKEENYDPRTRDWYKLAMANPDRVVQSLTNTPTRTPMSSPLQRQ